MGSSPIGISAGNAGSVERFKPRIVERIALHARSGRHAATHPYWHLWTDAAGVSHQAQCALAAFELKGIGNAAPQWNNKHDRTEATVVVTVQPVGWVGDWHENPAPQWITVLSGRWWIESMDGTRIEQGPGEFSFGEDQGCTEMDGRKGHRSGTIGDQPAVLMCVQLHVEPRRAACHMR